MAEPLPDAWDATLPPADNLIKEYVLGYADLMEALAAGRFRRESRLETYVFSFARFKGDDRLRALGRRAGVLQLLDRHNRDCAAIAAALGVPHHVVPTQLAPFDFLPVLRSRFWREVALWWPERRVLVAADALGTVGYFRAPGERIGVHPALRLKPPRSLRRVYPEHILTGHGKGVHEDAAVALHTALRTSRRRLPAALWASVRRR